MINHRLQPGFAGRIPGIDPRDGLLGRIVGPDLPRPRPRLRPVIIARATSRLAKSPHAGRHCTLAQ